ncbi:hypothetical protein E0H48_17085 [Rhizobium leguminosarum bv. viciae]|nr:hypothetical protein E0H48_17085 [Rhizobium leguminosarum bv. viciae]
MKFFRPARSGECGRVRQLDVVDTLPFDQILHNLMFEIKARTVSKFQLDSAERRKTGAGLREMRRVFALQPAGPNGVIGERVLDAVHQARFLHPTKDSCKVPERLRTACREVRIDVRCLFSHRESVAPKIAGGN